MRIDVVSAALAEPERFTGRALIGDRTPEPEHRWRARAVIVALNRYQAIPLDVYAVVENVLRRGGLLDSKGLAQNVVDAIHAGADPVGIALGQLGLNPEGGLPLLLAEVRRQTLHEVYEALSAKGRGHTRGSWQQAASLIHRRQIAEP